MLLFLNSRKSPLILQSKEGAEGKGSKKSGSLVLLNSCYLTMIMYVPFCNTNDGSELITRW